MSALEKAWDYPPRGMIIASCGHRVYDDGGEQLGQPYHGCDAIDGFYEGESWGCYCPPCALRLKVSGLLIADISV